MTDTLVSFRDVDKSYDGTKKVVAGLNLDIARGEFLTLLGPSGSGKTTTLMMLAGFEAPTGGSITFDGRPITDVPTYKRDFGMVFQNYALFPHMTVAENLAFPLRMREVAKGGVNGRVTRPLDIVELGDFADRRPGQLSGGQAQRVALARAIVFDPRMVLMDEPLGALDKQLREHMQLEIKRLHRELGITMLYVTHDQTEALTMSDRIAVFDDGRIQQIGTPEDMYGAPANKFVASFMGENNTLAGTVTGTGSDGEVRVRLGAFDAEMPATSARPRATGDQIRVMVRPEDVVIATDAEGPGLEATISDTVYYGDHLRLVFECPGNEVLTTRVHHRDVGTDLSPGRRVRLTWAARDARAFKP